MNNSGKTKSIRTAYLLWLPPLGLFGAHRFYAKRMDGAISLFIASGVWVGLTLGLYTHTRGVVLHNFGDSWLPYVIGAGYVVLVLWWIADGFLVR